MNHRSNVDVRGSSAIRAIAVALLSLGVDASNQRNSRHRQLRHVTTDSKRLEIVHCDCDVTTEGFYDTALNKASDA